jgi:4-diphosphocytidyl-2-C-methyl-D-erythritol kinase
VTTQAPRGRSATPITLLSPAKVNLFLNITGKRPDGFHELETIMVPLDFGDTITLELRDSGTSLECDNPNLPVDQSNLALRAATALSTAFQPEQGAKIILQKRIPLAAGLAGGSSNAATVLTGLNRLWQIDAPTEKLDPVAASLGSDINFFLRAGAAICRGRGERVEPIPCKLSATVLLINPGFGISTKWAYQSWAESARTLTAKPPDITLLARALAAGDLDAVGRALFNSLEAPSVTKFPVLELLKLAMRAHGAAGALMSGSGATVFGLFAEAAKATACGAEIRREFGPSMWTQVARFT